jgi:hypothetical protein
MNEVLMRAVVEAAVFAALSGDDVIREDAAVAFLEQLASTIGTLSKDDRQAFARYVGRLADEERADGNEARADFLVTLPDNLGLEDNTD